MADPTSGNLGFPYPTGADQVSGGPDDFQSIVQILDAGGSGPTVIRITSGTLSTFTSTYQANPGSYPLGTVYTATDADVSFLRDGTPAWRSIILAAHSQPLGTVTMQAGTTVPADPDGVTRWMLCQGQTISRSTYAALFAVIGTTYGAGDGSTTFNLPDFRTRMPLGAGTTVSLGATGGSWNHTHSVPGLSIPGLSIPGLSVPQLTVPSLSIPAHHHGLGNISVNGGSHQHMFALDGSYDVLVVLNTTNPWGFFNYGTGGNSFWGVGTNRTVTSIQGTAWNTHTHPTGEFSGSVGSLSGVSGDSTMTTGGGLTGTGTTGTGTTGTGTTGTGTSGSANPPYIGVNFQIKVL